MTVKIPVFIGLVISLFFCQAVFADESPTWLEFDAVSKNGKYIAEVRAKDKRNSELREAWNYMLTVFEIKDTSKRQIWSCDYNYNGYPLGELSDDGSAFVYVNRWYYNNEPLVYIYRKGKGVGTLLGRDFNIEHSKLKKTSSHELWLEQNLKMLPSYKLIMNEDDASLILEIHTIDKNTHRVDLRSERLKLSN